MDSSRKIATSKTTPTIDQKAKSRKESDDRRYRLDDFDENMTDDELDELIQNDDENAPGLDEENDKKPTDEYKPKHPTEPPRDPEKGPEIPPAPDPADTPTKPEEEPQEKDENPVEIPPEKSAPSGKDNSTKECNAFDAFNRNETESNQQSQKSSPFTELTRNVHNFFDWIAKPSLIFGIFALALAFIGAVIFPPLIIALPIALGLIGVAASSKIISSVSKTIYNQQTKPTKQADQKSGKGKSEQKKSNEHNQKPLEAPQAVGPDPKRQTSHTALLAKQREMQEQQGRISK